MIAGAYLAGTNTRRVRRALNAVFAGPVGKDVVSRVWRKTKGDWDAWNARSLAEQPIVRLILDGTVARARLDRRATSISLLVALGVRADGQKMLLRDRKRLGGEGEAAWRALLNDLVRRVDPYAGAWSSSTARRVSKRRWRRCGPTWLSSAAQCTSIAISSPMRPSALHEEISNDYRDMIYAATRGEVRPGAKRSSANGGSKAASSPTACAMRRRHVAVAAMGHRSEPRTRSSDCTRSSSAGSRFRPCCPAPTPPPCCSGRCWPQDRSSCARSTDGTPWPRNRIESLTSPHDRIP